MKRSLPRRRQPFSALILDLRPLVVIHEFRGELVQGLRNGSTSALRCDLCVEIERRDREDGYQIHHKEHGGTQRRRFGF